MKISGLEAVLAYPDPRRRVLIGPDPSREIHLLADDHGDAPALTLCGLEPRRSATVKELAAAQRICPDCVQEPRWLSEAAEALASALHHENIGRDIRGWVEVREAFALVKDALRIAGDTGEAR